jgi:predicted DCC family thiol-disulfide oxidoreductase YuxK
MCVPFAAGWHDRPAAFLLWYAWACLFGRNPLIANPGLPYVGWILLAHVCLPPAPYGSWAARGRVDPGGGWRMPPDLFAVAWVLMALGYSYSGSTKLVSPSWVDGSALARVLENPLARPTALREWLLSLPDGVLRLATWGALGLELAFAPLALVRRLRPWLWTAMLGMHLSLLTLFDFTDLSLGMVMLHLFTFDPAWVPALAAPTELVFYDGHCGLCHRAVRFALAEDRTGTAFRFATLDSDAFREAVSAERRQELPDSVVVRTADGRLLVRSAAVVHLLRRLGGAWRLVGGVARLLPAWPLDRAYDALAAVRHRLFGRPSAACPLMPPELRKRFVT